MVGVSTPLGAVVSVQPERVAEAQALLDEGGVAAVHSRLGEIIAGRSGSLMTGVFRWGSHIADLDDVGEWIETDDPRVPEWLRPFNGPVLVALDTDGAYAAGVGRKRHDDLCQEIAVATELAHRGRGLARRLVAQAARRIVDEGCVATYLHRPDNAASAAVAEAAGFPDLGWHILGLPPSR